MLSPTPYLEVFAQRGGRYHAAMLAQPHARDVELRTAVALAELADGHVVLDLPAGGGYLAPHIEPRVRLVPVEGALGFPAAPGAAPVADLRRVPLPDAYADRIICLAAAHHVPDEPAFYRELRRLLRPGGVLSLADGQAGSKVEAFLNGFVDRHTALGHRGRFLDAGSLAHLREAGFTVTQAGRRPCPWSFPDPPAMVGFCRHLFGIDGVDDAALLTALGEHLGYDQAPGRCELRWELLFLQARAA